jgi:hypothetical protein
MGYLKNKGRSLNILNFFWFLGLLRNENRKIGAVEKFHQTIANKTRSIPTLKDFVEKNDPGLLQQSLYKFSNRLLYFEICVLDPVYRC